MKTHEPFIQVQLLTLALLFAFSSYHLCMHLILYYITFKKMYIYIQYLLNHFRVSFSIITLHSQKFSRHFPRRKISGHEPHYHYCTKGIDINFITSFSIHSIFRFPQLSKNIFPSPPSPKIRIQSKIKCCVQSPCHL